MSYPRRLGIFARSPIPGTVKTRLVPPLTMELSCDLYGAFLSDLTRRLQKLKKVDLTVFHAGASPELLDRFLSPRGDRVPQVEGDLGVRLSTAFARLLEGPSRIPPLAVMIGSDSPDLPLSYIRRAFLKLKQHDVVLGPATDGGYYMIGLRQPLPALFHGIDWGTDRVLGQTLSRIAGERLSLATLPPWYDVDTGESLRALMDMTLARKVARRDRLHAVEAVLTRIIDAGLVQHPLKERK